MPRHVVLDHQLTPSVVGVAHPAAPGEGQVHVRVTRAGVNFWEIMQRRGRVPAPANGVPGSEGAGVVEQVGPGVRELTVGTRVAWSKVHGSYAEHVVASAEFFQAVPDAVDDDTAAGLLLQGATAAYLCQVTWPVVAGDTVVVTAAAGGVGLLLTQLLVARGARVIGIVSSSNKVEAAMRAGAQHVVTYSDSLADDVRAFEPGGVGAVFDAVGAGVAEPLLGALRARGAMVLYGSSSGHEAAITAADLSRGSLFLTRTAGRDYLPTSKDNAQHARLLLDLAAAGKLQATVDRVLPLDDVARAWDALESRINVGKVLLAP